METQAHTTENLNQVIQLFEETTFDIETILDKEWLKPAAVSNIARLSGLPESFVRKVIDLIYESPDC